MVSKNNHMIKRAQIAEREVPHYGLRKLGVGVVSVLLGTTMYLGANSTVANADELTSGGDINDGTSQTGASVQNTGKVVAINNTATQATPATSAAQSSQSSSAISNSDSVANAEKNSSLSANTQTSQNGSSSQVSQVPNSQMSTPADGTTNISSNNQNEIQQNNINDELTDGYAEVYPITQYAWGSVFSDVNESRDVPPVYGVKIKFEKDNTGKYKVVDLDNIAKADTLEINTAEKKPGEYKAYFVDKYNHKLTVLDPNKIDTTHKYPLFLKVVPSDQEDQIYNGGGTVLQSVMDQYNPIKNNKTFEQAIDLSGYKDSDLEQIGNFWSIFDPSVVADKAFNNDLASENNWKTLCGYRYCVAPSSYIKALLTTGLPTITRNGQQYYLVLNSDSTYKSQDIDELYNLFNNPKALQKSINGLDVQNTTLIATNEDKGSQTLAKLYNAETSTELNNLVENYQNGNATAAQNPTVLMIPELGENDELIPGKYAGRMILYYKGLGSDEGSPELKVMYSSMDPGYRGKLPSIYNYLGGGDAECAGMFVLPQRSTASITYIDDTLNKQLPGGEEIEGHYTDKISFSIDPSQQIANYVKQGYKLVSNDYKPDQLFNSDGANNVFEVHFVHNVVPKSQTKVTTRTIHYILNDGSVMHDNDGNKIPNVVQKVIYTGNSYIDKVTDKPVNAKQDANKNWVVDTTNTATPKPEWKITSTKDKFIEVPSPVVSGYVETPEIVKEETPVMPETQSVNEDVYVVYKKAPITYKTNRETKTVTRTIKYLDSQTGQEIPNVSEISQVSNLSRDEITDEQGKVIGYGTVSEDGHSYQLNNAWMLDKNGWKEQGSPDLTAKGYKKVPHFIDGQDASIVKEAQPDLDNPVDQTVKVYYDHDTIPVTPNHPQDKDGLRHDDLNKTVIRTINYQDTTGKAVNGAPDGKATYQQSAHFTRTAIIDKVTDKILGYDTNNDGKVDVTIGDYAWTPIHSTFDEVDSKAPKDLGYTNVDVSSVGQEQVAYYTPSQKITVTYSNVKPEQVEKAILHIIDITDGNKELNSFKVSGKDNTAITFDGAAGNVDALTKAGYKVHSIVQATTDPQKPTKYGTDYNTAAGQWKFDNKPSVNQEFYVFLEHDYTPINPENAYGRKDLTRKVVETVHYVDEATGKPVASDYTNTLTFTGQGMVDKVTGKMLAVKSTANGKIAYDYDLKNEKNISTAKDSDFVWSTPTVLQKVTSPTIDGYTIDAAKTTPSDLADGNDIKAIENVAYSHDNVEATVYYKANPVEVHKAELTIYANGQEVGKTSATGAKGTAISFENADNIVQAYLNNGYKFDHAQDVTNNQKLSGTSYDTINFGNYAATNNSDQKFAIYLTKAPAKTQQSAELIINDVTPKKAVQLGKYTQSGLEGTPISFVDTQSQLNYLLSHGYIWKDVSYNGQSLPAKGYQDIKFGNYDSVADKAGASQQWVIELVHNIKNQPMTTTSTAHVHYIMADGTKAPADSPVQTITWTKTDQVDQVTGKTVKAGTWTPDKSSFADVESPEVQNYQPNMKNVHFAAPQQGNSYVVTVIYTKNDQKPSPVDQGTIEVTVHDVTTDQDLTEYGKQSGVQKVGTEFNYDKTGTLKDLKDAGYKIINPEVTIPTTVAKSDQHVTIYVEHQIIPVTPDKPGNGLNRDDLTKTVTETIHYEGAGEQTPAAKTAKLFFNGTAYYDSVTKKWTYASGNELKDQTENVTWIAQSGNQFATVVTPTINGYTSKVQEGYDDGQGNVKEIPGIDQNSKDIDITVAYSKAVQPTSPTQPTNKPTNPTSPTQPTKKPTSPTSPMIKPVPQTNTLKAVPTAQLVSRYHGLPASQRSAQQNSTKLPQTGNQEAISAASLGLMGLALAGGLAGMKKTL